MLRPIRLYVSFLVVLALGSTMAVFFVGAPPTSADWKAGFTFGALVALSYLLAYQKTGRSEAGSIAFLPLLAAVFVAPAWSTIITTAIAMAVVELVNRRAPIKAVFNVAQAVIAVGTSIVLYLVLGGESMAVGQGFRISSFIPVLLLFVFANTLALAGVIATSESKNFFGLLRQRGAKTLVYDLYALPFVYVFAWVYLHYGIFGAIALVLPIMGVRELYKTNWELRTANQELLELMVAAIEARDPYTSGHSRRVAASTRRICEALSLREKITERIVTAALLHDVGKIHEVFAPILSKPGRLTADENKVMQTHPIKSEELVQMVSKLRDLASPVRHHHENWDGSGYPDGLSGEAIPLGSRIIMFADTIDAMTTDRPYRPALSSSAVQQELERFRGKQFDPRICDVILTSNILDDLTAAGSGIELSSPVLSGVATPMTA